MGKWTSFATGMGEGYLGAKRYIDNKKERDENREMLKGILAERKEQAAEAKAEAASTPEVKKIDEDPMGVRSMYDPDYRANGGMIGEMPHHFDKMSWQRTSFKK